jgi:hypothetical protein
VTAGVFVLTVRRLEPTNFCAQAGKKDLMTKCL